MVAARFIFILMTAGTIGCSRGNKDHATKEEDSRVLVEAKAKLYCGLSGVKDRGWAVDECDGAGFTSLHAVACQNLEIDLGVFEDETGRMHRSPDHTKCWNYAKTPDENKAAGFKAGFSRDHVLMRLVAAVETKDLAWVNRYLAFANTNKGKICDAIDDFYTVGRCMLTPTIWTLLYDAQTKLEGEAPAALKDSSDDAQPVDYEAHLQVLRILLRGRISGAITDGELASLKAQAERVPENALFQAAYHRFLDGDQSAAYRLLLDEKHWPDAALPTSAQHCTDYLYQRDSAADWAPCPEEGETFDGTDFVFAAYVAGAP